MFKKDFDTLKNEILVDFRNFTGQEPTAEIIKDASLMASCVWGLRAQMDVLLDQIFPDTASNENLAHHAWIRNMVQLAGESRQAFLERYLGRLRRAPAGGNRYDFERWAKECRVEDGTYRFVPPEEVNNNAFLDVASAYCIPLARGIGTVDVVIVVSPLVRVLEFDADTYTPPAPSDLGKTVVDAVSGDTGKLLEYYDPSRTWWVRCDSPNKFIVPPDVHVEDGTGQGKSEAYEPYTDVAYTGLVTAVQSYIRSKVCVTVSSDPHVRVYKVQPKWTSVTIQTYGNCDLDSAKADIESYMKTLIPGETLYLTKIAAICLDNGASNAVFPEPKTPAADVTATSTEVIRPNIVTVL